MDAYLEEELINIFTFYLQNSTADELESKKQRAIKIGKELYQDGGVDAMENMFYSVEIRIKEEIGRDVSRYRSWWNGISEGWTY
ncbi:MAG TPA: hypothetical protein VD815_01875 [Candidatus Saccharimonadales bacterium]|nr:hypothetical protein [Candidatus Saccharimonadales bacterium]